MAMGMLPAEFFTAEVGLVILLLVAILTVFFAFFAWADNAPMRYAKLRQQQRRVELYVYAAQLKAGTRNGGVQLAGGGAVTRPRSFAEVLDSLIAGGSTALCPDKRTRCTYCAICIPLDPGTPGHHTVEGVTGPLCDDCFDMYCDSLSPEEEQ